MSKTAVITGATSGIGAAFARRLAVEGYDLIITGKSHDEVGDLLDDLKKPGDINANLVIAEFSRDEDIQKVLDAVNADHNIEFLVNCAGYRGPMKPFIDSDVSDFERMIKVHQVVPVRLISAVLPQMIERQRGTIINVSSMAAFLPVPEIGVYGGTKSFLRFFSEVLHQELRGKGIKIQALCPGYTLTNFAKDSMTEDEFNKLVNSVKFLQMSPEEVVEHSWRHLKKKSVVCIPGIKNKAMVFLLSLLPRNLYYKITAKTLDA
ncbi:SDR family NAD(P)-dependent oxidoreductase [Chloroflexota bacterium]